MCGVAIYRQAFMFDPTHCTPSNVSAVLTSTTNNLVQVESPFDVVNCAALPFKPSFTVSTQAKTSKANGASLTVNVAQKPGEANIRKVDLQLPAKLPARLSTLQKACLAAQFEANPAGCPEASVIGHAVVHTPILSNPLSGPAYLVSHGNEAFPDVEFILQGEGITIVLDGHTQIKNGITYSRFETVPDAPFTTFEAILPEGPHSILGVNLPAKAKGNFCGQKLTAGTIITAQNGAVVRQNTKVSVTDCSIGLTKAQKLAAALKACRKKLNSHRRAIREARQGAVPSVDATVLAARPLERNQGALIHYRNAASRITKPILLQSEAGGGRDVLSNT